MEEAALLAAIAAYPDEDTPRLAYADWLDDHADALPDPGAARIRAEFIRLQCELKKYEDEPRAEQDRYVELYRRQDAILTRHLSALLGPLGDKVIPDMDVILDRGFVSQLRLTASLFLELAGSIGELRPPPRLIVTGAAGLLEQIGVRPESRQIAELHFQAHRGGPAEAGPGSLLDLLNFVGDDPSSKWPRLQILRLESSDLGEFGLGVLSQSSRFPALTHLDVTACEISDDGIRDLVASPLWTRLEHLVLDANPISDEGATLLGNAAQSASHLEYLNLKRTGITSEGHRVLFRHFPRRTKLDLF
jgi:uncharacterized protein (TIGR02996 family)